MAEHGSFDVFYDTRRSRSNEELEATKVQNEA